MVVRDQEGKRRPLYAWSPAEVVAKRDEYLAGVHMGLTPPTGRLTVGKHLDDWLTDRRGKVRPATWITYESYVRLHLAPLSRIQLTKLRPADIRALVREREAAGCAPATIGHALIVLRMALRQAVNDGLVPRNIASIVALPRVTRHELAIWTKAERQAFLAAPSVLGPLWAVLLGTGLRLGEAIGLRWQDIDLDRGTLSVSGSLRPVDRRVREEGKPRMQRGEPKTPSGWRTFDVARFVLSALYDQKALTAHRPANSLGLVFTSPKGTALDPRNVSREWAAAITTAGVRHIRIHDARHTAASLVIDAGGSLDDIRRMFGHASIATTIDIYAHLVPGRTRELADGMDRAMGGAS